MVLTLLACVTYQHLLLIHLLDVCTSMLTAVVTGELTTLEGTEMTAATTDPSGLEALLLTEGLTFSWNTTH